MKRLFNFPAFAGEAFWIGFGIAASILALLVGTRFLTQLLSTDEYGRMALAVSIANLAIHIFGEPVGKTAIRFYPLWRETGKFPGFLQRLGKSLLRATGCVVIVSMVGVIANYYADIFPNNYVVVITGIFAILLIYNRVGLALEDAARKRRFRGIVQGGFDVMRFGFAASLIFFLGLSSAETALTGFVISGILIVLVHGFFLYGLLKKDEDENAVISEGKTIMNTELMQAFQTPLILSHACIWLTMMSERWVLNYYGSPGDVGGYAAVYQLAFVPMLFFSNFLIIFFEPIVYQMNRLNMNDAESLQVIQMNKYAAVGILCFSICLFAVLFFFHPFIGQYFLGIRFHSYTWIFPWLMLAGGCFAATQQLLLKLSSAMRTDLLAVLWLVVAVTSMIAYVVGAYFWQLKGIVAAVTIVNVSLVLFLLGFLEKNFNQERIPE